ncbi:amine oxidase [Wolfiporia cocos MD-104 SS10]|uniref:Amine oxidase n=1 Tax=Wolfiporia cocos (strain MD-104) TaxID=742152 RepID=A0A2H3JE89_WOLCO|nr:amine oxidase [Wolfiporia cocos MD-104 SS10]
MSQSDVIGSGVSGLAATWLLSEYTNHEVHLFEADARPGGHANTVLFSQPGREPVYIVFNPSTYPNFLRFLELYPNLRQRVRHTTMTFSVSRNGGAFEWAGSTLRSVFCQISRVLDPSMWRLLYDILRFHACARRVLRSSAEVSLDVSIGEYLQKEGYSQAFRDNYLIPMTAAIWSTPPDKCALDFSARILVQFMHNHHLLQVVGKPSWLTLEGGSRAYVKQIMSQLPPSQVHLSTPIKLLRSLVTVHGDHPEHVLQLETASGERSEFDHVVLACHSDAALEILRAGGQLTDKQEHILSSFRWNRNEACLHCDERLMPRSRIAWSCWNYLTQSHVDQVSLTYWMNDLQHISERKHGPVFVTLNPPSEPDPARVVSRHRYDHPVLDAKAVRAQQQISTIQGQNNVHYAGAWLKYGFHEDGFTSGLRAAAAIIQNKAEFLALVFDALERTGLRAIVGASLGGILLVLRYLFISLGAALHPLEAYVVSDSGVGSAKQRKSV